MRWKKPTSVFVFIFAMTQLANAQLATGWKAHDWERPEARVVAPGESILPALPPSDAIVLFDGSSLDQWCDQDGNPSQWKIVDSVMESVPGSGYIFTKRGFGDVQLHVEWASPAKVQGSSQGRGNSGVFLMGLYEVQVLDSFDNRTYADGHASSVYGQYPPLVNASRQPGEWQSYDIIFHRARFDARGDLTDKATITVFHNGVLTQDHTEPFGPTSWILHQPYNDIGSRAPLSFQDHGNPVRFRNVWLRELADNPRPKPAADYDQVSMRPSNEQLDKLVGKFDRYQFYRSDRTLHLKFVGNDFALIPLSDFEFSLPYTAATVEFIETEAGRFDKLKYKMGGDTANAKRDD